MSLRNNPKRILAQTQLIDLTILELEDSITEHKSECHGEPSVYVTTYGKYNDGY